MPPLYGTGNTSVVPSLVPARLTARDSQTKDNPLTFTPLWNIGFRLGNLPIKVYEFMGSGVNEGGKGPLVREEAPDHPASALLRVPNPRIPSHIMWAGTVVSMFRFKRCGWYKQRDKTGRVVALWPIPGLIFRPMRNSKEVLGDFEVGAITGGFPDILAAAGFNSTTTIPAKDIIYFRLMPDPEDWADGWTPLEPLGLVGDTGMEAVKAIRDLFDNGLFERLWLKMDKKLDDPSRQRLQAQFAEVRRDKFAIPVVEDGDLLPMGSAPNNDLMTSTWKEAEALIAQAFGIPADGDSVKFLQDVIAPIANAMEKTLELDLFLNEYKDRPAFAEFAFRDRLKGTPGERITMFRDAILSGQMTINEARREENRPPIEGGDVALIPLNAIPVQAAPVGGTPEPKGSTGGVGGNEGKNPPLPSAEPKGLPAAASASGVAAPIPFVRRKAKGTTD